MSGETDQALEMHNRYAQFQLNASACFTPGTPMNLAGWEKIDRTLHLKPFLELLVREFRIKLQKVVDLKSMEVATANWVGNEDLLQGTFLARDLIIGINENQGTMIARSYLGFLPRLGELKLVTNHLGVVILDCGVEWLKILTTRYKSAADRLGDIQKNVVGHFNTCSVNTIRVSIENRVIYYHTSETKFSEKDNSLVIITLKSRQVPKVRQNFIGDWKNKEGLYVFHKGEVIEEIDERKASLIEKSRADQVRYFNEFISKAT